MLAFDIETTGFLDDFPQSEISVVCTHDAASGEEHTYHFMRASLEEKEALRTRLLAALDAAPRLCAYNAVLFDVPFIQRQLQVPDAQVAAWLLKLVDPFHMMKTSLGMTAKLDRLLCLNGLQSKSACGGAAVVMAKEGRWGDLEAYCMDDVRLTAQLCLLPRIQLTAPADDCTVLWCQYPRHPPGGQCGVEGDPGVRVWAELARPHGTQA